MWCEMKTNPRKTGRTALSKRSHPVTCTHLRLSTVQHRDFALQRGWLGFDNSSRKPKNFEGEKPTPLSDAASWEGAINFTKKPEKTKKKQTNKRKTNSYFQYTDPDKLADLHFRKTLTDWSVYFVSTCLENNINIIQVKSCAVWCNKRPCTILCGPFLLSSLHVMSMDSSFWVHCA